jgi:O-methyltransferase
VADHPAALPFFKKRVRRLYVNHLRPRVADPVHRARLRLLWTGWGYWPLLLASGFGLGARLRLLRGFLRVDWHVEHGHYPIEVARIAAMLAERPARAGEVVVEAGCWKGGSSAKFSLLCEQLGYHLHVYDSFEGVQTGVSDPTDYDFSGEFVSSEDEVRANLERYGRPEVCTIHPGWFADTIAREGAPRPVRLVYIDCDLASGTLEVLQGVVPKLVDDGIVLSQDFHIPAVRGLLVDESVWGGLGRPTPTIEPIAWCTARAVPSGGTWSAHPAA